MLKNCSRALAQASIAAVFLAGCQAEKITHYKAAKAVEAAAIRDDPSAAIPEPPRPAGGLRWTLPPGWAEGAGDGMRYATLKPSVAGKVEISVVVLPGLAGGEAANVNRWRGQLGLAALDELALAQGREIIRTKAGPFSVYDFSSEGQKKSRMVAGLALLDGSTWFLKLLGDAPAVAAARPGFIHLLEGLHVDQAN